MYEFSISIDNIYKEIQQVGYQMNQRMTLMKMKRKNRKHQNNLVVYQEAKKSYLNMYNL